MDIFEKVLTFKWVLIVIRTVINQDVHCVYFWTYVDKSTYEKLYTFYFMFILRHLIFNL